MKLYKVLGENGKPCHGGTGSWPLPNGKPGEWVTVEGDLMPCRNGLHLCRKGDLVHWLGPEIYLAEKDGESVTHGDKVVVRRARLVRKLETWNERTARLFACDCAERALALVQHPDPRSVEAVRVARLYAEGKASDEELSAAREAAWAAVEEVEATWAAEAVEEVRAARAAVETAGEAAREAAWEAREARAARTTRAARAARVTEGTWQTRRLHEYLDGKL